MPRFITILICLLSYQAYAQELTNIDIYRDKWGVPHIYAPTDEEVAYGLAWAQCEDDFKTVQEQMLAVQGRYGEFAGIDGITVDFAIKFMGFRELVEAKYEKDLSPKVRKMLASYASGVNNYAATHPKELLLRKHSKVTGKDLVVGYMLGVTQLTGATDDLLAILSNKIGIDNEEIPKGSNAFAMNSKKTSNGETFLAINSHQPMEGWYSWYEAHLGSDEGWNMLGGTFAGGMTIFHGVNEHLGWAHTVNHPDFSDVYELEMHPKDKLQYKFDGAWLSLKKKSYKAKLKLGFLKIPIKKSIYESKYGPTFKAKDGKYYAWRFVSGLDIKAPQQWYDMNRATNLKEFKTALKTRGLVCTNIVYADEKDNIYFISNGKIPERNPAFNWKKVLPGNTSNTLWDETVSVPFEALPQVENPASGYVFNTNNTPFNSTEKSENPIETDLNESMGFQESNIENNRSMRFMELMKNYDKVSWEDFKTIKYDNTYPQSLRTVDMMNLELILKLDASKYPAISDAIKMLNEWDRKTDLQNQTTPLFLYSIYFLWQKKEGSLKRGGKITEAEAAYAIQKSKETLLEDFEKINPPLWMVQRHIRGRVNIPIAGGPDVLAAIYSTRQDNAQLKAVAGDTYIQLARFTPEGVKIESSIVYGASAKEESPHFTDQMPLFVNQKLKPMTLDWEQVKKEAVRKYHPLKVID